MGLLSVVAAIILICVVVVVIFVINSTRQENRRFKKEGKAVEGEIIDRRIVTSESRLYYDETDVVPSSANFNPPAHHIIKLYRILFTSSFFGTDTMGGSIPLANTYARISITRCTTGED